MLGERISRVVGDMFANDPLLLLARNYQDFEIRDRSKRIGNPQVDIGWAFDNSVEIFLFKENR